MPAADSPEAAQLLLDSVTGLDLVVRSIQMSLISAGVSGCHTSFTAYVLLVIGRATLPPIPSVRDLRY